MNDILNAASPVRETLRGFEGEVSSIGSIFFTFLAYFCLKQALLLIPADQTVNRHAALGRARFLDFLIAGGIKDESCTADTCSAFSSLTTNLTFC